MLLSLATNLCNVINVKKEFTHLREIAKHKPKTFIKKEDIDIKRKQPKRFNAMFGFCTGITCDGTKLVFAGYSIYMDNVSLKSDQLKKPA